MAKRHLEKAFQSEFTIAVKKHMQFKQLDYVYKKIPDNAFIGNYQIKNPYDCYLRFSGQHWSMELKICSTIKVINFGTLFKGREHELDYLEGEKKAGGKSYVIVNQYNKVKRINRVFAIEINTARKYHTRGQIDIESIEKNNLEIFKIGKIMKYGFRKEIFWDLSTLFKI